MRTNENEARNGREQERRNEDLVRQMLASADDGDLSVLDRVWSPDIVVHFGATDLDRAQAVALLKSVYGAFPDMRHDVHDVIATDDKVVLRGVITGTHRGEFQGIAATGNQVAVGQIIIFRIEDGRIAEYWEQADLLGLMQQLGATAESPS